MAVSLKCIAAGAPLKLQYAFSRNICQIHCICTIHGCNCCSEISTVSIKELITAANTLWNKETLYPGKNCQANIKND